MYFPSPYYGNHVSQTHRYSLRNRRVPVHRRRVVSKKHRRTEPALKIQRAFRGYLVRKSVNKIAAINREVDEIEQQVSGLARTSDCDKARLRVSEALMSLLLKLDAVKGVDEGVRELRKAVIKRVIAIQERVDAVVDTCNESDSSNESDGSNESWMEEEDVAEVSEEERDGDREVLKNLVEVNEKMVSKMKELVMRNEEQKRMLSTLTVKVEKMEKAWNERSMRKKRRYNAALSSEQYF